MQYYKAFIFTKRTNLMPYFSANFNGGISGERYDNMKKQYEDERNVQLILLVRYEGGKTICRIKCPINPMPVKGEFEVASMTAMFNFMRQNGWTHKDTWDMSMFR